MTEPVKEVSDWLDEIASAKKRESDFRKTGKNVVDIYSGKKCDEVPFNILFSNTETLLPALFSQVPRPVVSRRFKDDDPVGKAAAVAAQRMLEYLIDTSVEGYDTFEDAMTAATLDALLPGRGVTAVRYEADIADDAVEQEQTCVDSQSWDRVYFGYAKKWAKVPWVAYEMSLTKEDAEKIFGKDVADKMTFADDETDDDGETSTEHDEGERKTATVYQIWDRSGGRRVRYVSPGYNAGYLKDEDDPLGLVGFFNCPRPIQFIKKTNETVPAAMYSLYENQAKELNRISGRIRAILGALKVRGAYDGSLGDDLKKIFEGDDNTFIPTDKADILLGGGFDKAIWMLPIEKLIVVVQNLFQARQQCKQVIYEITGISDIIRGSSAASETLGAQKIKESWGTLRLKRLQREVQRYGRDVLRIMLEIAATRFSEASWVAMTNLPYATTAQKEQAQAAVQNARSSGAQPDPRAIQALQTPGWPEVLKLLKNDMQRGFRIDIETNSTIDVEATEDQKNISEVMQAISQFMHGIGPMIESGTMPFEVAQEMLITITRRFRFGNEVEDAIKKMKAPQPKDDGAATKAAGEAQAKQTEVQQAGQIAQDKLALEREVAMEKLRNEHAEALAKIAAEREVAMMRLEREHAEALAKIAAEREVAREKTRVEQDTELKTCAMTAHREATRADV